MSGRVLLAAAVLILGITGGPAPAFTPGGARIDGKLVPRSWPVGRLPLTFRVNDRPLPQLLHFASNSLPNAAVEGAIRSWVSGTGLTIRNGGPVATLEGGEDSQNLITFADTPQNRDLMVNRLGLTMVLFQPDSGEIVETDIILNPGEKWATDGRADVFDAEETLVHEMGHALGLDHSGILSATMNPTGRPGSILQRRLDTDDMAGARFLYPHLTTAPNTGLLTGRVISTDNRPILGAHVVAVDAWGITQVGAVTHEDGGYRIPSLPVGSYQVYAEPLDGPITLANLGSAFRDGVAAFRTLFAGGNTTPSSHTVTAGQTTVVPPIKVEPKASSFNPIFVGLVDANGDAFLNVQAEAVRAGADEILLIAGRGLAAVTTDGFGVTGGDIQLDRTNSDRGTQGGIAYAFFPIHIADRAAPGPRSLILTTPTERAVLSGAIEVLP